MLVRSFLSRTFEIQLLILPGGAHHHWRKASIREEIQGHKAKIIDHEAGGGDSRERAKVGYITEDNQYTEDQWRWGKIGEQNAWNDAAHSSGV